MEDKIIEGNKLIAEFMGLKAMEVAKGMPDIKYEHSFTTHGFKEQTHEAMLLFHSSWDWLIPVIDKITSSNEYYKFIDHTSSMIYEGGIHINTKFIESTWNDVVEFIKWYNSNK